MKTTIIKQSKIDKIDFDNLQFGKHFSDHMFSVRFKNNLWEEPEIKPYGRSI